MPTRTERTAATTALPTTVPGGSGSAGWASYLSPLPPATADAVQRLARRQGTTPAVVLLAGFLALLTRCTGEPEPAIGYGPGPALPGEGSGPLPLRCRTDGDPDFTALVRRAHEAVRTAAATAPAMAAGTAPAAPEQRDAPPPATVFAIGRAPAPVPAPSGAALPDAVRSGALTVTALLAPPSGPPVLCWTYDTARYDAPFIEEMAHTQLTLLADAVHRPGHPLGALRLLDGERRAALLRAGTGAPVAPAVPLARLAEAVLRERADAVALRWYDTEPLDHAELFAAAAGISALLDERGVPENEPIGLCMARTPMLIAALLGILLSGRSYLPLDPAYPAERTAFTLRDSGARRVLVDTVGAAGLPDGPWETIDAEFPAEAPPGAVFPRPPAHPGSAAYTLYTSGSTGRPKGCVVSHRNLDHFVRWALRDTPPEALARTPATASVCFDMSLVEILPTLLSGGTLELLDTLHDLAELPPDRAPTRVCAVPSLLQDLLREQELPPGPLLVCLGGEAPPAALVARLYAAGVDRVRNLYGPTEITVLATAGTAPVPDSGPGQARPVPLGGPVPGARVYVVDDALEPLPPGCPGELVVGGDGVSTGYRGRPGLTAERFVPDVLSGEPGARLYRTGDRARWTTDGRLECLGRLDDQVKLRGLRIEPGEIEYALTTHEAVEAAWAVVAGDPADPVLTAYVQYRGTTPPDAAVLRRHALARLPVGLVPTAFTVLREVPLTPTGKVDRARLTGRPEEPVRRADPPPADPPAVAPAPVSRAEGPREAVSRRYEVVVNDEEQYALHVAGRELPPGWRREGTAGDREHCLARVERIWTDPLPRSLRLPADGRRGTGPDGDSTPPGAPAIFGQVGV
ncbi:amino acid adenylation domain-containing protein [Streptomyces sp. NPDC000594]|uniref:amino acid adenylation domain-containing protein n=1 Tax=Streptomyces sp. NPDC000594 TaxID=3154261 RepID=UPI00332CB32F